MPSPNELVGRCGDEKALTRLNWAGNLGNLVEQAAVRVVAKGNRVGCATWKNPLKGLDGGTWFPLCGRGRIGRSEANSLIERGPSLIAAFLCRRDYEVCEHGKCSGGVGMNPRNQALLVPSLHISPLRPVSSVVFPQGDRAYCSMRDGWKGPRCPHEF